MLLGLHTFHLPPIDLVETGQLFRHGSLLLTLVAEHLMHHIHLGNGTAALASCLADLGLLPRVLLAVLLTSVKLFLVPAKLTDVGRVPEVNESASGELQRIILFDGVLCQRKGGLLPHRCSESLVVHLP